MKILLFTFLLILAESRMSPVFPGDGLKNNSVITCENYIVIAGESNINKFSFTYVTPALTGNSTAKGAENETTGLLIPVRRFKPSNPKMYDDFLSMLKADEYPFIGIVLHRKNFSVERMSSSVMPEKISVTIAGVTKDYFVNCSMIYCYKRIILQGMQTVRLTDFGLTPPVKLNGIVKVHDELDVSFGFILNFTGEQTLTVL